MRVLLPWGLVGFFIAAACGDDTMSPGPSPVAVTVTQFSIDSSSVVTGQIVQATVTLSGVAPAGGTDVTLTSSHAAATVPSRVTVPSGAASQTFGISTSGVVGAAVDVSITATSGTSSWTAVLRVTPLVPTLVRFGVSSPILGGLTGSGFVELDLPAPPGGASVALRADDSVARVSSSSPVVIPAGAVRANLTFPTGRPSQDARVTITATYGDISLNATVRIARGVGP
jgi:large repetitive protein